MPEHRDYRRYKDRNRVERMLGKLKQQRRIANRYDKTLLLFKSFLNLAATRLWLKSFVNTAYTASNQRDRGRHLFYSSMTLLYPPGYGDLSSRCVE